jgi:hypothetical protein
MKMHTMAACLSKAALSAESRWDFLSAIDAAIIATDQNETRLNLAGSLPYFATHVTPFEHVAALWARMQPETKYFDLIRFGPAGEGGYAVPDDLKGIATCFSAGVKNECGFEYDCALRGMNVFMADASVSGAASEHPRFSFENKFVGAATRGEFMTLSNWVRRSLPGDDQSELMLQMDMEGAEYETILATPEDLLRRFRIVVIKFHYLDYLFSEPLFALYSRAMHKILAGHTCVHAVASDVARYIEVPGLSIPQFAEFTFIRTDRIPLKNISPLIDEIGRQLGPHAEATSADQFAIRSFEKRLGRPPGERLFRGS